MTVNYTDLFENVGEYVERVNEFVTVMTNIGSGYLELAVDLETNGRFDVLEGEFTRFESFKADVLGWINQMKARVQVVLTHKATVLDELMYGNDTTFPSVIAALFTDMVTNTQSIAANTVTLGSVTMSGSGSGLVIVSKVLDGFNPPSDGYPVVPGYNGIDSQLALTDDMALTCLSDSETSGLIEGNEQFQWAGRPSSGDNYSWLTFGTGSGPTIGTIQASTIMVNMGFDAFNTNVPSGWVLNLGTAGTHVREESGANAMKGSALRLTGNATIAEVNISQAVGTSFSPNRRYMVGFWIKSDGSISAGNLTIQFEGTDYTAGVSEKIDLDATALAALTDYEWQYFWINMPEEIPDDMELVIKLDGTPSANDVFIDYGGAKEATYFNGHCAVVVAGEDKFLIGDRAEYTVSNNYAGVFQTAFTKLYGFQLPSSGSPTQADSLAT